MAFMKEVVKQGVGQIESMKFNLTEQLITMAAENYTSGRSVFSAGQRCASVVRPVIAGVVVGVLIRGGLHLLYF